MGLDCFLFLVLFGLLLLFLRGLWVLELELLDIDVCWSPELSLWLSSALLDVLLMAGRFGFLLGFFFFVAFSFLHMDCVLVLARLLEFKVNNFV